MCQEGGYTPHRVDIRAAVVCPFRAGGSHVRAHDLDHGDTAHVSRAAPQIVCPSALHELQQAARPSTPASPTAAPSTCYYSLDEHQGHVYLQFAPGFRIAAQNGVAVPLSQLRALSAKRFVLEVFVKLLLILGEGRYAESWNLRRELRSTGTRQYASVHWMR